MVLSNFLKYYVHNAIFKLISKKWAMKLISRTRVTIILLLFRRVSKFNVFWLCRQTANNSAFLASRILNCTTMTYFWCAYISKNITIHHFVFELGRSKFTEISYWGYVVRFRLHLKNIQFERYKRLREEIEKQILQEWKVDGQMDAWNVSGCTEGSSSTKQRQLLW